MAKEKYNGQGYIFDIQRYSISDGPGIRTTVFFKGCPLSCLWCSNPESQSRAPELLYFPSLCIQCKRCLKACPTGATRLSPQGTLEIDRQLCQACGACVKACFSDARKISGRLRPIEEVMSIVKEDLPFYKNSGGGVTASGGEPTSQADFLVDLFKRCQESGIHTVLDTCGYAPWKVFERVIPFVDLLLYDIKHMDVDKHEETTGVGNELILANAKKIAQLKKEMIVRIPLIPGYNDSSENIEALAAFVSGLNLPRVELVPYHKLGQHKYRSLGLDYQLSDLCQYKEEQVETIRSKIESYGIEVRVE